MLHGWGDQRGRARGVCHGQVLRDGSAEFLNDGSGVGTHLVAYGYRHGVEVVGHGRLPRVQCLRAQALRPWERRKVDYRVGKGGARHPHLAEVSQVFRRLRANEVVEFLGCRSCRVLSL